MCIKSLFSFILKSMTISIYTDGGSKGNPGPASIGIVAYDDQNKELFRHRADIGVATNNVAEYTAVLTAMSKLKTHMSKLGKIDKVHFFSDSQLLVNQLNGKYKIKNSAIAKLIFEIRGEEMVLGVPVHYIHIRREKNWLADKLVNNKG